MDLESILAGWIIFSQVVFFKQRLAELSSMQTGETIIVGPKQIMGNLMGKEQGKTDIGYGAVLAPSVQTIKHFIGDVIRSE